MEATDREGEKEREAQLDYWLMRAGESGALEGLRALADANPDLVEPALYLAMALGDYGEPLEAAQELARRASAIPKSGWPRIRLVEARMRRSGGHAAEAEECARSVLGLAGLAHSEQAEAFAELGYALEDLGRRVEAFGALERSLELSPSDRSVRFHLAYQYSRDGFRELAIVHYEAAIGRGDDSGALNNLGIQYAENGLVSSSVRLLKRSSEAGLSLAAGNLAMNLVNAGYGDEARVWIDKGRSVPEVHARVDEAASRLAAKPVEESTALEEIRTRGRDLRQVFRLLTDHQTKLPQGQWRVSTGLVMGFTSKGSVSSGSVGEAQAKSRIDFTLEGGRLHLKWSIGEYGLQNWSGSAVWDGDRILAYIKDSPAQGSTAPLTFTKTEGAAIETTGSG
jgi:tetratricopeptide (TPR) repeat protein